MRTQLTTAQPALQHKTLKVEGSQMITISVKQLGSAIDEADTFTLPDMNDGTRYIHDELYGRLSKGAELRLSDIDFSRFALEDIDSMRRLYANTLEANERGAERLAQTLWNIVPVAVHSPFV
jgi:hypothetical protein